MVFRGRCGLDGLGPIRRPSGLLRTAVPEGGAAGPGGGAAVLEGGTAVLEDRAAVLLTGPVEVRRPALGRNARPRLVHRLARCGRLRRRGAVLQERGEFLGIRRIHAEHHPRAPPGLLYRVTDVAGDRRQRFCRQAVRGAPAVPSLLKHCRGALRAGYEPWIRHCAILP